MKDRIVYTDRERHIIDIYNVELDSLRKKINELNKQINKLECDIRNIQKQNILYNKLHE